jgi:glycosyltransferase involved in cell wall biosynthesis
LLVVSHVVHYDYDQQLHAFGPYSREIDIWADLFSEVSIAAPLRHERPPSDCLSFTRPNISVAPQWETGGDHWTAKVHQILCLPGLVAGLARSMSRADAIHVRCPGNLGLLGAFLAPLFSRYMIAKYAGQWNGFSGERPLLRLQRAVLASRWWRGPVTVYGDWPNQPSQVRPFFTSMMTSDQIRHAVRVAESKRIERPLRVLFSGRLAPEKRIGPLLEALRIASDEGLSLTATIAGDGVQRAYLEQFADELGIRGIVKFTGALPYETNLKWYEWAHCLVLPSRNNEGWPKVLAEAMCHGVLGVAVGHGQIPAMLEGRGVLLQEGNARELASTLKRVAASPEDYYPRMRQGSEWSRQFSLETLRTELANLLAEQWPGVHIVRGSHDMMQIRFP